MPPAERHFLGSIILQWMSNRGFLMNNNCYTYWLNGVTMICCHVTFVLQCVAVIDARDDPERLMQCFCDASFGGMCVLKEFLRKHRHCWISLLSKISHLEEEELEFETKSINQDEDAHNIVFSGHIKEINKKVKKLNNILSRLFSVTAIGYMLTPFIEYGIRKLIGAETAGLPHITQYWSPLKTNLLGYILAITLEILFVINNYAVHTTFDFSVFGIMIFISGQFRLLHDYSEGDCGSTLCISETREDLAHAKIKKCHEIHVKLIRKPI
ncbi:unnamed protein product [Chilo suppressalis]|uniref:Odorant receptor n=1 Tax=Chilo suppressalis TaxID=168631 RepID=A0ABN8L865_CHISP|nr:unnamed protein product [Chilo suppressalis]